MHIKFVGSPQFRPQEIIATKPYQVLRIQDCWETVRKENIVKYNFYLKFYIVNEKKHVVGIPHFNVEIVEK